MASITSAPSMERRRKQLRTAKREQRSRQQRRGLVPCQVVVPRAVAELLREAAKRPDVMDRLRTWLAPEVVEIAAWPQLREICWSRHDRWISGADALAIYERNWRFVSRESLTEAEARLIRDLAGRHGNGVLNV